MFTVLFILKTEAEPEEEAEESKWQDRISSGFDKLVAFASTELDKRRRSTEGSDSCNTSPDSGIGHGDVPQPKQMLKLNPKPMLYNKVNPASPGEHADGPPRTPSPIAVNPIEKSCSINPALLKYQRHTEEKKHKPDQHFKKKFYYWEQWREDSWKKPDVVKDKFRPKGKDWNWNREHGDFNSNQYAGDEWGKCGNWKN